MWEPMNPWDEERCMQEGKGQRVHGKCIRIKKARLPHEKKSKLITHVG
jgi:hypothetical protein